MRTSGLAVLAMGLVLSGCGGEAASPESRSRNPGRYAGIGTYDAGRLWAELAGVDAPSDAAAATVEDDEHVIVVVDSHTGEVRQCGDYSGVCVTMNPWAAGATPGGAPVKLKQHAADLDAEYQASIEATPEEAATASAR